MIDRQTGRSRGFGFVRFATSEGVEAAMQTPHLLDGQWIDVKRAQPAENLPPPKKAPSGLSREVWPALWEIKALTTFGQIWSVVGCIGTKFCKQHSIVTNALYFVEIYKMNDLHVADFSIF